jgi:hypothetical protein
VTHDDESVLLYLSGKENVCAQSSLKVSWQFTAVWEVCGFFRYIGRIYYTVNRYRERMEAHKLLRGQCDEFIRTGMNIFQSCSDACSVRICLHADKPKRAFCGGCNAMRTLKCYIKTNDFNSSGSPGWMGKIRGEVILFVAW